MRTPMIAGNWKMNLTHVEATDLAGAIVNSVKGLEGVDIVLCPPFTSLGAVAEAVKGSAVKLGAQNMHWAENGAYTGEVSANMLLTHGCGYVILGHSERRGYFGETDAVVALKVISSLAAGLLPIVCVGETREEREEGVTQSVVERQVRSAFEGIDSEVFGDTVIAYEPVWAIGTGLTATVEQAQEVHALIRRILTDMMGGKVAERTRILYGGSMKPQNASELVLQPDVDGGLIGGASLDADSMMGIVKAAV